ncbi:Nitroreductase [Cucurbitaria berberidis CBS 394.84]|uniref:Nitroreductase n=1 Tax=Cucurbitaria berberidis CBS 394.84 TaxID=1168544 RepID=A0A9P4G6X6_9PLEO|nr:Nitroreductase [Cucurbitaria berberidis CBS 394.84]KAF1840072.1 Nitroreductase [Cucurbitaria berberidis CBS 394.84]
MAAFGARPLLTGLIAGLLLALLLQQVVQTQLPLHNTAEQTTLQLPLSESMAQVLRNTLQAARQRAWAGGYKSARLPSSFQPLIPSSSNLTPHTLLSSSTKSFSTTPSTMSAQKSFIDAVKDRRTIYQLTKEAPISDKQIQELAEKAILHVPSSFNSQSTRLVVLLNKDHDQFWDFVLEALKPLVPEDQFASTEQRVSGFKAGYGTVLFYEDPEPVEGLRKSFPLYAHHFGTWSEHTNAMHQYALWVALEAEGFGANLQHYNPIIDQKAASHWNIPLEWKLRSQLVFGGKGGEAGEKQFQQVEGKRLFVHGAKQ